MNTTTIVKMFFPVLQEDLRRFMVEVVQGDDGRPKFAVTYLSKKIGDAENYKDARELFASLFKTPEKVVYHCEDVTNETAEDDKTVKVVRIEERFFKGEPGLG